MDFRKELYFSISATLYVLGALLFHQDDEKGYSIIDLIVEIIQNDGAIVYKEFLDEFDGDPHRQRCALLSACHYVKKKREKITKKIKKERQKHLLAA